MSTVNEIKKRASNVKFQAAKIDPGVIESVVVGGDLSKLTPHARITYYKRVCDSLGLNPLTKPFDYIVLNGKLTLYARKDCTQQLCKIHKISTEVVKKEKIENIYVVTVRAKIGERCSEDDGAVDINGLSGDKLCNAMMKAVTKAKRRAVLGICGLGHIDETETETTDGEIVNADDMHNGVNIEDVQAEDAEFSEEQASQKPPKTAPEATTEPPKAQSGSPAGQEEPESAGNDQPEPQDGTSEEEPQGNETRPEPPPDEPPEEPPVEYINEAQRKRLLKIASEVGHTKEDVNKYIALVHDIDSTTKIPKGDVYDKIILHFESMKEPPADQ